MVTEIHQTPISCGGQGTTGGGGGGGTNNEPGAAGGSGIVIIRYRIGQSQNTKATGGSMASISFKFTLPNGR